MVYRIRNFIADNQLDASATNTHASAQMALAGTGIAHAPRASQQYHRFGANHFIYGAAATCRKYVHTHIAFGRIEIDASVATV